MTKHFKHESGRYRGIELEMDLLGPGVTPDAMFDGNYKGFDESVRMVREHQIEGWNATEPAIKPTSFANDCHSFIWDKIENELGEELEKNPDLRGLNLKVYNARKSHLDHLHHIDLLFTLNPISLEENLKKGVRETEVMAGVDITENPEKANRDNKMPVLFISEEKTYSVMDFEQKKELLNDVVEELADTLLSKLRDWQSRRKHLRMYKPTQ